MPRLFAALAFVVFPLFGQSQGLSGLADILSFEGEQSGSTPAGWGASPAGSIFLDNEVVHGGKWAVRIERKADTANSFSGIIKSIPMEFSGATIEFRGFIRTEDVSDFVALWIREDGDSSSLAFDSLQKRRINGTRDWTEYSITVPVHAEAKELFFGFLVSGTGKAWVDDLRLLVDGKPIWDAPKAERAKTVFDTDHEFDAGSGIAMPQQLTPVQIGNLATLGKIWGFLKYHHRAITSGRRHWDYDLFRMLPAVLAAPDRENANLVLAKWVAALGPAGECDPCAKLDEAELHLRPDLAWIDSEAELGADLSRALHAVHRSRPTGGRQFYIWLAPGIGNPMFLNEPAYSKLKLPDAGFQLLAVYRFWNIVEYWFPYRDMVGDDWDKVLAEFIPRVLQAKTAEEYQRELLALIARAHDTHANLWSGLKARPPVGDCEVPAELRFVESRFTATASGGGIERGDVIEALDGIPVAELVERWKPYYAASNDAAAYRDMARNLTRGACGETRLRIRRGGEPVELAAKRVPADQSSPLVHDVPGQTFRRLSDEVAYLKLSSVIAAEAPRYIDAAAGSKGLIIDIRNYPSEFVVFAFGSLLVDKETPFARFTQGDLANPGAFRFAAAVSLKPGKPHYGGQVVILVDEVSLSQAEYTAMAFRASPRAFVIGSTTAGADGNVSQFALPGGQSSMISGIGVFYPDKRPTQRIGIVPDLEVKPTLAGVRAGRDEVLEAAIRRILGPDIPAARIEELARAGRK